MSKTVKFSIFSSFSLGAGEFVLGRTFDCTSAEKWSSATATFFPQILAPFSMCRQAYKNEKPDSVVLNRQAQNSRNVITCHFALFKQYLAKNLGK